MNRLARLAGFGEVSSAANADRWAFLDGVRTVYTWAFRTGTDVKEFPANWARHGRSAGPIRNQEMAEYADALIALWDGKSKGTENMISEAQKRGLKVYIHLIQ